MESSKLAQVLGEQGRKKSWLASQLQVDRSTVTRWVKGVSQPTRRNQANIAKLLGVPVKEIFK
jgi:transcriptional regulator with XRE-family HTH domain